MNQQQLSSAGQAHSAFSMPPETDSSGDAVAYIPGNTQAETVSILPEMAVGSPQKRPEPGVANKAYFTSEAMGTNLTATQTTSPQTHLPPPPLPKPVISPWGDQPGGESTGYWKTVVVSPTTTPSVVRPAPIMAPPIGYATPTPTPAPEPLAPRVVSGPTQVKQKEVVKDVTRLPTMVGGNIVEEEEAKPLLVRVIAIGFYLLAFYSGLVAVGTMGLAYLLNTTMIGYVTAAIVGEFSRAYPSFALFPISVGLITVWFTYVSFLVGQGSRKGWVIGTTSLLIGMSVIMLVGYAVLTPLELILENPQFVGQEPLLQSVSWEMVRAGLYSYIGCLLLVGLLLVGYRHFRFPTHAVSSWQKWVLIGVALITIGGVGGYFVQTTIVNNNSDLGYAAATETAGFHVYKPKELPPGWSQTSFMAINTAPASVILGRDDFVEVYFDRSLTVRAQGQPSAQIILRQIDVPAGFDLEAFARALIDQPVEINKVEVMRADGQEGYAMEKLTESNPIRAIALKTSDNVLLLLVSKGAQVEDMIALANSLD